MATTHLPVVGGHPTTSMSTVRTDNWWAGPAATFAGLMAAIVYLNWAAFQGDHYYAEPYLSPLYSPVIFSETSVIGSVPLWHAWFGSWPSFWPEFLPPSPAFLILPFPAVFRLTCYYYRKAYYRSFAGSPPGCAVTPMTPGRSYRGETAFMVFQNLHRLALPFALILVPILYYDAFVAFVRHGEVGIGVGTVVLLINATLLAGYTFGCHSFRHLIGGRDDCMSGGKDTFKAAAFRRATWCNERHMRFAWLSLFWVAFTDFYVRMVSMGVIHDFSTWT